MRKVEFLGPECALSPRPLKYQCRIQGDSNTGEFRRWISVGEGPTDGASIANVGMADKGDRFIKERAGTSHEIRPFNFSLSGKGANVERSVALTDVSELLNPIDIDQEFRTCQAQCHHGHKALSSGKDFPLVSSLGQGLNGFAKASGRYIFKGSRLHGWPYWQGSRGEGVRVQRAQVRQPAVLLESSQGQPSLPRA